MAKTGGSSGIDSRQQALSLVLCQPESSEPSFVGSHDARTQYYCSTSQSPKANSDQRGEDCDRSADDGFEKTLPGMDYVFGKAMGTENFDSQSPSTSGSCASTSENRHHCGELADWPYYGSETPNHSTTGSPHISLSEDSGRPWTVNYVGSRDIINEGLCHIYDDGFFIPAYVNGEWVNPELGLTKNGKPRKRLGRACKSCNSKKIKCEPGHRKCRQCEKAQIECI